jgi:hypothetical protein
MKNFYVIFALLLTFNGFSQRVYNVFGSDNIYNQTFVKHDQNIYIIGNVNIQGTEKGVVARISPSGILLNSILVEDPTSSYHIMPYSACSKGSNLLVTGIAKDITSGQSGVAIFELSSNLSLIKSKKIVYENSLAGLKVDYNELNQKIIIAGVFSDVPLDNQNSSFNQFIVCLDDNFDTQWDYWASSPHANAIPLPSFYTFLESVNLSDDKIYASGSFLEKRLANNDLTFAPSIVCFDYSGNLIWDYHFSIDNELYDLNTGEEILVNTHIFENSLIAVINASEAHSYTIFEFNKQTGQLISLYDGSLNDLLAYDSKIINDELVVIGYHQDISMGSNLLIEKIDLSTMTKVTSIELNGTFDKSTVNALSSLSFAKIGMAQSPNLWAALTHTSISIFDNDLFIHTYLTEPGSVAGGRFYKFDLSNLDDDTDICQLNPYTKSSLAPSNLDQIEDISYLELGSDVEVLPLDVIPYPLTISDKCESIGLPADNGNSITNPSDISQKNNFDYNIFSDILSLDLILQDNCQVSSFDRVEIHDVSGKLVLSQSIDDSKQSLQLLENNTYKSGVYFISFYLEKKKILSKQIYFTE